MEFDREDGRLHLTREGGHSRRRVVHVKDTTGREVERALLAACDARGVAGGGRPGGGRPGHQRQARAGRAEPGAGRLRPRRATPARWPPSRPGWWCWPPAARGRSTSTPPTPTSRPATAWPWPTGPGRAVANLEFFQFHPTCLFHPQAKSFLISEALRGEGGILRNARRRAVHVPLRPAQGAGPARHRGPLHRRRDEAARRRVRLPGHDATCPGASCSSTSRTSTPPAGEYGIDMAVQPIPVVPAAHYLCGGVVTDLTGPHLPAPPLRRGRGLLHRPARRQPAGLQLAAGGAGLRPPRRHARPRPSWPPPTSRPRSRTGTPATPWPRTRAWW